ncbi:MAG: hypothetical protein DMF51_11035 [Acidobacteria bacterium]|nr:MAG: hypothetical protein DMF51_11035 [Acidobacteriota bacterium]
MNRNEHGRTGGRRRAYEPPILRRVRLVPDEAVLASCKNNATAGPAGPIQKCATNPAVCSHSAS